MLHELLETLRAHAERGGLNLFGLVDRARFDACEPKESRLAAVAADCGTVLVLGSGGRWLAERREHWHRHAGGGNAVTCDDLVARATDGVVALLAAAGIAARPLRFHGGCRVRGERLAEAAGLGVVSPVSGLLLHPRFGPWLRVRAAVLCAGHPFGQIADAALGEGFQPCSECARPCLAACPAHTAELAQCADHRHRGGCADACGSRNACPLGAEHRDHRGEDAHRHAHELPTLERWYGLGSWALVPKSLRGGP